MTHIQTSLAEALVSLADAYAKCAGWRAEKAGTDEAHAWADKAKTYAAHAREQADEGRVINTLHCMLLAIDSAGFAGGCIADRAEQEDQWLKATAGTDALLDDIVNIKKDTHALLADIANKAKDKNTTTPRPDLPDEERDTQSVWEYIERKTSGRLKASDVPPGFHVLAKDDNPQEKDMRSQLHFFMHKVDGVAHELFRDGGTERYILRGFEDNPVPIYFRVGTHQLHSNVIVLQLAKYSGRTPCEVATELARFIHAEEEEYNAWKIETNRL